MPRSLLLQAVSSEPDSFVGQLTTGAREELLVGSVAMDVAAGRTIFSGLGGDRVGVVLRGLTRTQLNSHDGRQLTIRYARAGSLVGSVTPPRSRLSVQAVTDCTLLELDREHLLGAVAVDGAIGVALIAEIARLLTDTYAMLAVSAFGTMRERVARQLLDLATGRQGQARLIVFVTQQELAESVGTAREVVGRILSKFRAEGLVETRLGEIELCDPERLSALVRSWQGRS